jgi:hypothetical protein
MGGVVTKDFNQNSNGRGRVESSPMPLSVVSETRLKSFMSSTMLDSYNKLLFMATYRSAGKAMPSISKQLSSGVRGFEFAIKTTQSGERKL